MSIYVVAEILLLEKGGNIYGKRKKGVIIRLHNKGGRP